MTSPEKLRYWRHRWAPQHVSTVDTTGTINAPQWEPVHVLSDAEFAALAAPTREQVVDELRKHKLIHVSVSRKSAYCRCNSSVKAGTDDNLEWFELHRADAVLALMRHPTSI